MYPPRGTSPHTTSPQTKEKRPGRCTSTPGTRGHVDGTSLVPPPQPQSLLCGGQPPAPGAARLPAESGLFLHRGRLSPQPRTGLKSHPPAATPNSPQGGAEGPRPPTTARPAQPAGGPVSGGAGPGPVRRPRGEEGDPARPRRGPALSGATPAAGGTPEEGRTAAVATRAETRAQPAAVTLPLGGAAMLPTSVYDDVALFTCFPSAPQQPPSAPTRPRGRRRRTRVGHAPFLPPPGRGKAPRPQGRARLGGGAPSPRPSRRVGASASGGVSSEAAGRKEEKMAGSFLALVLFWFFLLQRLSSFRIPRTQLSARLAGAQPRGSGLPVGRAGRPRGLSLILPLGGL